MNFTDQSLNYTTNNFWIWAPCEIGEFWRFIENSKVVSATTSVNRDKMQDQQSSYL